MADTPVIAGYLTVRRKGKADRRYVALFDVRLGYWATEEDLNNAITPRGQLSLADLTSIKVSGLGIIFNLPGNELTLDMESEADLRRWLVALRKVARGKLPEEHRKTDEEVSYTSQPLHSSTSLVPAGQTVLCSGTLGVMKKAKESPSPRHFVLTPAVLNYYDSEAAASRIGVEVKGQIIIAEIIRFEEVEGGFNITISRNEQALGLRPMMAESGEDLDRWIRAFAPLLRQKLGAEFKVRHREGLAEAAAQDDGASSDRYLPTWQRLILENPQAWKRQKKGMWWTTEWKCQGCATTSKDTPPSVMRIKHEGKDLNACEACYASHVPNHDVFCQGLLDLVAGKKAESRFFVLQQDQLVQYESVDQFLAAPSKPIAKDKITSMRTCEVADEFGGAISSSTSRHSVFSKASSSSKSSLPPAKSCAITLRVADAGGELRAIEMRNLQGMEDARRWGLAYREAGVRVSFGSSYNLPEEAADHSHHHITDDGGANSPAFSDDGRSGRHVLSHAPPPPPPPRQVVIPDAPAEEEEEEGEEEEEDPPQAPPAAGAAVRGTSPAPAQGVVLRGPMVVENEGESEELLAVLYHDRLDWLSADGQHPQGTTEIRDIAEVDLEEEDSALRVSIHGGSHLMLRVPASSPVTFDRWTEAIGQVVEEFHAGGGAGAGGVQAPPPPAPAPAPGPATALPFAPDEPADEDAGSEDLDPELALPLASTGEMGRSPSERKLREIFDRCDRRKTGFIQVAELTKVARESPLVAEFLGEDPTLKASMTQMARATFLQAMYRETRGRAQQEISWQEFWDAYERWAATQDPAVLAKEAPLLHQGPMNLMKGGKAEVHHVCIYRDRLEHYADASSAARRTGCLGRVQSSDILSIRIMDDGFVLGLDANETLDLRFLEGISSEPWVQALRTLASESKQEAAPVGLETMLLGAAVAAPSAQQMPPREQAAWEPPAQFLLEANNGMVAKWLADMTEKPIQSGVLGFHDKGRLVPRLCVLFEDNLGLWEQPLEAAHGARPVQRLLVKEIKGFETVGSGFILNLGSKKIGVHVRTNDDLHMWSQALLRILAPPPLSGAFAGLAPGRSFVGSPSPGLGKSFSLSPSMSPGKSFMGVNGPPAQPEGPKKKKVKRDIHRARSILDAKPPERYRSPSPKKKGSLFTTRALQFEGPAPVGNDRDAAAKGFKINTHKDGGQAQVTLHGPQALILTTADRPGNWHVHGDIAEKVTIKDQVPLMAIKKSLEPADKVTGKERVLVLVSPVEAPPWHKITLPGGEAVDPQDGSKRRARSSVTGKVNMRVTTSKRSASGKAPKKIGESEEGRRAVLQNRRAKASQDVNAKITDIR